MHSLKTGENVIEIEVTSEDEVNTKIYKVIVNRKGSKNNYLKSLSVKEGNIEFSREKKEYEIEVEYEIDKVNVEAVAEEENASIIGQGEREIKIGENNVNVIVTAEDGSVREYIIKVKRKNPVTSKLLNIEVKNYELDSVFDSNKTEYEVEVDNEIESIEINVSKLDPGSTYVVEGNENFKVGLNEVRIISTSSDGKESTTYVIRVNRQSYSNTYLSSLSVEGYTLSPVFDKKELSYEVIVEKEIEKVRVDASAENIESKVEGLGETLLNEKETEIKVRVISKSGVKRIYKIKVIKKLGNNANIKNISTQKGKIEVVNETSYKMTVGKTELKVRKEDLVIELEDKNASIEMEEEILLEETRIYKIKVISEDKSTEKEYVINVEKEKSSDGRLKSLSTNYGEISPEFNKDVKEYIVNIEEEKEEIELTIEKNEEDAEIVTKERVFGIKEYETEINIIVQAENGEIETYKIKVIKSITRKLGLKNIEITKVKEKCESCILPKYEENTETYEMSVPSIVKEIGIEYEKNHPNQKVKIYKGIEEIKEPYTLETGENIYKIEVENSYGEKREYIYRIEKLRSDNNYLKSLKIISPEKEIEGFNKEKQEYEIEVENNYENIKVEAEAEDIEASIEIKGTTYLIEGNNDVRIIVSAGNKEKREYILHVLRKPESNNLLKTLTVSSGSIYELSPKFRGGINNYYLKVGSIVDKVSVEGIAEDENAVVEGNGEKELKIGLNEIEIKVISKEKVERIYKIKIERESSKNIYLKKLEILNGEISPEFNKEKQEYEVNVKNTENELKMEVEAEDPNAKVEIIGNENLTYGENIVKIKVISSDLSVSRTYLLKVTKEGEENNNLKGIKINEEEIEGFDKEKIEYEKEVENNVEKVKIEGIKESENASVIGNGIYSLEEGENKIIIKVVAQNKEEKEYIIKIKRKYNNYLKEIVTDKGEVIPEFKKETLEYTLEVENKEENITVIGIKEDKDAVVEGNGKYELKVGENKIIIKVKNKEQEERDYIIKVRRKGSDNNNLKYLTVIESEFEKEFDKNELEYTVYVRDTLEKITIKEEAEDPDAQVEIIGNENFSETEEEVKVRVTSTSGKIKEYKIKVIREEESKFSNYLSELSVSEGVLSPKFNKEESEYAVTVGKDIKRIKVNGIRESIESTVEGLGEKELEIGRNEIRVVVRSKDGKKRTYTIIVYRKEESDGRISEIGIENGELSPVFNKNKYSYKLRIESDEKIIKINRVKTVEKEGTYKIEGDLTKVETGNVIKIIGESADKKDKKEYVIEVEREKSRNANLKEIKVSEGSLSPEFNKEIKEYTLKIGENVERVKIEGIKESEKASVQGNGVYEGKNQIVNIVVVSENGEVNVYRVKIEKEKNRNNYLKSLKVKGKEISPEFNKEINEYEVVVSEEEDIVIVEAEKENNLSEVIYNKEVKIKEEETKEKIEVISESGDIRIYTLTIKKEKKISSKIKSLEVKEGVISPEFNKEILEYNVRIPNEKEKITLEIELEDKEGTYKVIGNENLKVGENEIEIEVTSSDGKEKRVYKINVEREELSNNYLKSLKVKGYEIEFNKEELNYEIEIEKEIEEIEVEAEAEVKTSTVIGTGKYEIKEKEKEIIIKVESENKVERNYKIKIRKKKSDNNYLSNIIVSEGNIEFSREKIEYEIKVNEGIEEIEIEGIKEEEDASVIGNGRYKIEVGEKEIKLIVTSENGSIREYKIKVIREASSNTNIVRMTPSEGTLTPAFNNEETEYEIMVGKEVNVMDIEVELESKDASVQGNKNIIIEGRRKEVNIIVEAEDGSTRIVRVIIKKESGVEEIRVEKEEIMIGLGEEKEIKVTVLPEEAENKNVRYETGEEIVRIEGKKIIGEKIGRTIVKIISEENEEIKKEIIVNVILKEIKTGEYEVRKVEEGKILIGMEEGTTLGEIKEKLLNEESTIKIYNEENKELEESEIVKTGERIKVEIEGEICDEAIIILRGDINCDGEVNVTDKTIIKNHILSKEEIIDYRKYAADVVEDNEINVSDNTKLGNYLLGKITTLN